MTKDQPLTPDDDAGPKGQPAKGTSETAWQDEGSLVERLRSPSSRSGRSQARNDAAADAVSAREGELVRARDNGGEGYVTYGGATVGDPTFGDAPHADAGHHEALRPAFEPTHEVRSAEEVTRTEKRAERLASAMFLLSSVCVVGFLVAYLFINVHQHPQALNIALGTTLGAALFLIGAAAIVWAKGIMPHEEAVQERHPDNSSERDKELLAADWSAAVRDSGATRRKLLLATMGLSMGTLALPALFLFRDLGPSPFTGKNKDNLLDVTPWAKGMRLVDIVTQQPINIADIDVGSLITVVPQGHTDASADSSVMVIRMNEEDIDAPKFQPNEVLNGVIVYSKICTHAGCPVSLYEQQRHHFLCPCHQSTFDAADRGKVLFGPAARALPILPIYADEQGYIRALAPFQEPVGPSFWERG